MSRKYFGTDGIRGRANGLITPELALKVGQAAGLVFQRGEHRHRVVIGKDTRLSGYMIENAMVAGFTSVGMDVLLVGPMPTPAVAMLTKSMRADLGVMISASHNLFEDNGIKLFGPLGYKLSDDVEKQIEELLDENLDKRLSQSASLGRARRIDGVHDRYIEFAKSQPRWFARRHRLRPWRRLQGGAGGALGTRRGRHLHRCRAGWFQHQQGMRIDRTGSAEPQGARDARRYWHCAGWRRRSADHGRRAWPSG
jgi:phosphomannomutase